MNAYQEMKKRHQKEIGEFPSFFAFNDKQFKEGMEKLGVKDTDELCQGFAGMVYRKADAGKLKELMERQDKETKEAFVPSRSVPSVRSNAVAVELVAVELVKLGCAGRGERKKEL